MVSSSLDPLSIPEGLWGHGDFRSALDRRDIASLFRLVRQHTGASQTRIGIATGLAQGTVCLIMKGGRLVTAIDVLERIAGGLAMPDEARLRLGLAPRVSAPRPESASSRILTNSVPSLGDAQSELAAAAFYSNDAADRLGDQPSVGGVGPRLAAAADESTRFLGWAEVSSIGDLTIEQMHDEVRRVARNYLKLPMVSLFERTRFLRDRAFAQLSCNRRPSQGRDLYSIAGWSLTLLAWMSTDLGYPAAAEEHLRAAWLCAENAGEDHLQAWVRGTQHTAARWQNDFVKAGEYAEDGLRYAHDGSIGLFLESALALDRARYGDHNGARAALARAQVAVQGLDTQRDRLAGPFSCSVGRAGGFWSDVYLTLGQPAEALSLADDAVAVFERTAHQSRNSGSERMVRCRQVKAHILLGDFDNAWESLVPVLGTAPEHRVRPLLQIVLSMADMTARPKLGKPSGSARDIHDSVMAFCGRKVRGC